ncbi:protein disulfide-isomerase precursor [Coemansia brasiliensis]|uniref:Protein disulfide-isomerase n=1 Tax=Coemansia brasiliensis TaxID=2650707 RepID=A0A9W8I945_9FUNG|nr:protein disulfide-isomerase precursor [Coemansia brasiliensis]
MQVNAVRFMLSAVAAGAMAACAAAASSESDVKVLTTDTFKEWTASQSLALVEFYAPWCGHCKALAPEYEKAATMLKPDIGVAKVDCTEEQALCEEMEIPGFPTLKVFKDGDHAAYNGTRKAQGIVNYMRKQLLPPLSQLTAETLDQFTKSDRVVVIGFIDDKDSTEYKALDTLANELRDEFNFGVAPGLAKEYGVKAPAVIAFKEFDDGQDILEEITVDSLRKFIKTSSVPVLGEISGETYSMYAQTGLPFGFIFFDSPEMREQLEKELYDVAKANKDINFVLIDANKYGSQADHLNLEHQWPAFAIQAQSSLDKYPFSGELTSDSVAEFVQDYLDGKLEPSYKSEPIPQTNDGDVMVLVSKQFNEIAFDKSQDVLVEFYAPWCGHCKNLAPTYDKLGRIMKGSGVVIAKMDAIANDVPSSEPELQIYGFPTIVLIRGEDNAIIEYKGNRSLESLVEFIEENAATKVTVDPKALKDDEDEDEEDEDEDEDVVNKAEEPARESEASEASEASEESKDEEPVQESKAEEPAQESKTEKPKEQGNHDEL